LIEGARVLVLTDANLLTLNGRPLRVLVVEDDTVVAMDFCSAIVSHGGFVVGVVGSGMLAETLALATRPDVIVMDVWLRDGSGTDVARVIRSRIKTKIVFCSGSGDEGTAKRVANFRDAELLFKPVDLDDLVQAIATAKCGVTGGGSA
jgi:DNA-binding response OmpR family regulator